MCIFRHLLRLGKLQPLRHIQLRQQCLLLTTRRPLRLHTAIMAATLLRSSILPTRILPISVQVCEEGCHLFGILCIVCYCYSYSLHGSCMRALTPSHE